MTVMLVLYNTPVVYVAVWPKGCGFGETKYV